MGSPELQEAKLEAIPSPNTSKDASPPPPLPAAPDPSTDPGVVPPIASPPPDDGTIPEDLNIFVLTPVAALKMLCRSIDSLVKLTGDVPPTPPLKSKVSSPLHSPSLGSRSRNASKENIAFSAEHKKEVPETAIGSPEAHHDEPIHIIGAYAEPVYIQQGAIARKFYSKRPPPISTEEYLLRMHRYCPMSTAVYLATSLYINRLAVVERVIAVTPRNVHRLLLAGLRVAMKALEDLSYPHSRFAKVGGVSEVELGRLEITFCFLTNFELKVDAEMLQETASSLREVEAVRETPAWFELRSANAERKKPSPVLQTRPMMPAVEAPS
jgi:Cyclin